MGPATAHAVWIALNCAALFAGLIILIRPKYSGTRTRRIAAYLRLARYCSPRAGHGESALQSTAGDPVLLLLVLMMRALQSGREAIAGSLLALAIAYRVFPILIAGYLILQSPMASADLRVTGNRHWRDTHGGCCGVRPLCLNFVRGVQLALTASDPAVVSIRATIIRWLCLQKSGGCKSAPEHRDRPIQSGVRAVGYFSVDLAIVIATTRVTLAFPPNDDPGSRLFALWVAATVVLSLPVVVDYDLTLMLIPFALIAVAAPRGQVSRRTIVMAIVSYTSLLWWEFVAHSGNEGGFYSMLAAYLTAYWFATDHPEHNAGSICLLPLQLWLRIGSPA